MRKFWSALAVAMVMLSGGVASAGTMSVSQTIHLTGVVPPMRFMVVDRQGNVTELTSNTLENVAPRVFLDSLQSGIELPLTPALQKDYAAKAKGLDLRSVDKHFSTVQPKTAQASRSHISTVIRQLSWLRLPHPL